MMKGMREKMIELFGDCLLLCKIYAVMLPHNLFKAFAHPKSMLGDSYFPDKNRKSSFRIWCEQLSFIIRYGSPNSFYFLYGMDVKNKSLCRQFVHYAPFMRWRDKNNAKFGACGKAVLRNKLFFGAFTKELGIASPSSIAAIRQNSAYPIGANEKLELSDWIKGLNGKFFLKPIDGECGKGAASLEVSDQHILLNGHIATISDIATLVNDTEYLCQAKIEQHHEMSRLYPHSVNTIRLITILNPRTSQIDVLPALLRIGNRGSIVDNTSCGGIAIGIDLSTGRLNEFGIMRPRFGKTVTKHPDTGIAFSEFAVPFIKESVEQAKRLHQAIGLHSIGWDIAIGENGPIFIEGNENWEINGPQSVHGGLRHILKFYT